MNQLSLNVDETLAHFMSLRSEAAALRDSFSSSAVSFSDDAFGLVHVDATRRLKAALEKLHSRNISLAQGLSDVCHAGMEQVFIIDNTDSGNSGGISGINDRLEGGKKQ